MCGDGGGHGPPPDLRPHGQISRGVESLHLADVERPNEHDSTFTETFACLPPAGGGDGNVSSEEGGSAPQLFFADRPQLRSSRTLSVDEAARPLSHATKRGGTVVALSGHPDIGTGQAYRSHVPLSTQIRVNDTGGRPVSSLLDTGASLSTIDATLLRNLGGVPTGTPIRVNGLGATETAGWATITFFIAARDSHGRDIFLECYHDFHVLPNFLPGLCLGLDFISHHAVSIDIRHDRALLGRYAFPVTEKLPAPYAKEAELCCRTACHIPARASAWVPVDSACLAPGVDYTIHPRFTLTADERVQLGGPVAVASHGLPHVLVTNFGAQSITLPRRAPIADAVVARLGDATVASAHAFNLDAPMGPDAMMASMAAGDAWSAIEEEDADTEVAAPLDLFEGTVDPSHDLARDAATTLIDDHFKVGLGADGKPPPAVVDLLRRHRAAFALDGRPGLIIVTDLVVRGVTRALPRLLHSFYFEILIE
ncbi:hypothetical protein CF335_g8594 [Tilletia laevis]|nr:hypothetical protein CF335_g8594 [Tilletia laevis]